MIFQKLSTVLRKWGMTGFIPALARFTMRLWSDSFGPSAEDSYFDLSTTVETVCDTHLKGLTIASVHKSDGSQYSATPLRVFSRAMRSLPKAAQTYNFVDYGCGKGRVLLLAASHGFQDIVGVDFSEELCHVADANLQRYREKTPCTATIEVCHADASDFELPDGNCVMYFFHPFGETVMKEVARSIDKWLRRTEWDAYVVYVNPQWRRCFDEMMTLELCAGSVWTSEWYLTYRANRRMTFKRQVFWKLRKLSILARRQGVVVATKYLVNALRPVDWKILTLSTEVINECAPQPALHSLMIERGTGPLVRGRQASFSREFFLDVEEGQQDCFVATIGEDLVAILWTTKNSRYVILSEGDEEVHSLHVRREFRGRGIARRLVAEASSRLLATECRRVFAVVDAANRASLKTFAACRYSLDGRVFRPLSTVFGRRYQSKTSVRPPLCQEESANLRSQS
jgi:ribosomal protein S18 acetylase RimI-like enzyme/predicted RNA methylase